MATSDYLEMTRILCTGGSGFVGSHLVRKLSLEGHEVFNYDIKEGHDIMDYDLMHRVFRDFEPEEVYHLAGSVHKDPAEDDPEMDIKLNYLGTLNVLKMCELFGCRMLFTGTGATYGISGSPQNEDDVPRPVSDYGVSKRAAELLIQKYVECHGVHGLITRYSSVYGPGRNAGPVNMMLKKALEEGWIRVDGPGHHTRDLIDVRDALDGTVLVMEKGIPGQIYNIGTGVETAIVEVAWIIHELTDAVIKHVPHKYGKFDLRRSCYDIARARRLGFSPSISLRQGIEELLEHERA